MNVKDLYPNQDPKIIYLYEIIGSYFTDIIFNHIYSNARIKLTKNASLVDEYIKRLQLYIIGLKNDIKCYENTFKELCKYYNTCSNNNTNVTLFINTIVDTCVPPNFIQQLDLRNKGEIVCNIICDLVSNLVLFASSSDLINKITINHKNNAPVIVKLFQDYSIQILVGKKINIMNKFLKESGGINNELPTAIDNLKDVIKKLLIEKNKLIKEYNSKLEEHDSIINMYKEQFKLRETEYVVREQKMLKLVELLQLQLQSQSQMQSQLRIKQEETESQLTPRTYQTLSPLKLSPQSNDINKSNSHLFINDEDEDTIHENVETINNNMEEEIDKINDLQPINIPSMLQSFTKPNTFKTVRISSDSDDSDDLDE